MIVAVMTMTFRNQAFQCLKDKRRVISSIKEKLRHQFNVSVIENDFQDLWQKFQLAVGLVSHSKSMASRVFNQIEDFILSHYSLELIELQKEFF